jgi:hypothetical protein
MYVKLKNKTENTIILTDVNGIELTPGSTREFTSISDEQLLKESDIVIDNIGCGNISVFNIDGVELTGASAVNYLNQNKIELTGAKHFDGRASVYPTSRPLGTVTTFTSYGDNDTLIGKGEEAKYYHKIGESTLVTKYLDFHSINNQTWIHDAIVSYKDCLFDEVFVSVVTKAQEYDNSSNTNFYYDTNTKLIFPSAGNGNVSLANKVLTPVQFVKNQSGQKPMCFWDCTYNNTTKLFENLIPKPNGDGNFNLFGIEVPLQSFVRWDLAGTGIIKLGTSDVDRIGHNMRLRFDFETSGDTDDHDWWISILIHLFRERTL